MFEKAEPHPPKGILFLGVYYKTPYLLLDALKKNPCLIANNQENKSEEAMSYIREAARNIINCTDKSEKNLMPFLKKLIKANQVIEGGNQKSDAIPLTENMAAYSNKRSFNAVSLYSCIFLIIREPSTSRCLGAHLKLDFMGGTDGINIQKMIQTFLNHLGVAQTTPLEAYIAGGNDCSLGLFIEIFKAMSSFNIEIKKAHLTMTDKPEHITRPAYITFDLASLEFKKECISYKSPMNYLQFYAVVGLDPQNFPINEETIHLLTISEDQAPCTLKMICDPQKSKELKDANLSGMINLLVGIAAKIDNLTTLEKLNSIIRAENSYNILTFNELSRYFMEPLFYRYQFSVHSEDLFQMGIHQDDNLSLPKLCRSEVRPVEQDNLKIKQADTGTVLGRCNFYPLHKKRSHDLEMDWGFNCFY